MSPGYSFINTSDKQVIIFLTLHDLQQVVILFYGIAFVGINLLYT